ncbi:Pla2g12a [Symbiodinium sp. CCMP2592]|nr:Pla2g12a [Symbiodinium sp. CCMP2592]
MTGAVAQQPDLDLGALFEGLGAIQNTGKGGKGAARADDACPAGQSPVPKMDQHSRMMANGCGPQGLVIKEPHGLFRCCNGHDVCFSVCGTSHDFCEDQFAKCMQEVCQSPLSGEHQECQKQAHSFSSMTKVFGSGFHKASQQDSCHCVPEDEAGKKHRDYLETFYRLYNESMLDTDTLELQLSKWKGKEAELYFDLVKKYGHLFVQFDDVPKEFVHVPQAGVRAGRWERRPPGTAEATFDAGLPTCVERMWCTKPQSVMMPPVACFSQLAANFPSCKASDCCQSV